MSKLRSTRIHHFSTFEAPQIWSLLTLINGSSLVAALWLLQPMLRCVCQRQPCFNDVTIRHTYFLPVFFGPMLSSCPAWIRPQMPSFFMSALYPMSVKIKTLYNIWVFATTADSGLQPLRPPMADPRRLRLGKPLI